MPVYSTEVHMKQENMINEQNDRCVTIKAKQNVNADKV